MTLTALPFASTEAEAKVLLPPGESLSTRPSWERQFQDALNNLSMGFNSTTQQYDAGVRDLIQQNSENYNFTPYVGNSFSVFAKNAPQEDGAGQSYEGMNVYEVADAISPPGAFNSDFVEFLENELLYTAEGIAGPLLGDHNFINDFMQETGRPSNSYNLAMNEFADGFNQFYSIPLIKFGVDTVGIIGSSEEVMAGMIARDLNHGSPLVQKVAAEWGNFLPTVSKLSTISQNVGYVGAVLDAYKYAGQISEGFSNNPFAGGGYEGLEFAVNALDGAMIGVALGGGPLGAIGALTYGIIRDRLDSDPVLVDVVKTLWDKTGFVGQIADAEVRIMNELLTPLLLEGMIAWDDLTGWEHFGVEDDANIAGYDHVQKMRELWYQKNQELAQLIREGKENTPEAQALIQWLLARQKWVKNDGPRAGHIACSDFMSHLHGKTGSGSHAQAPKQPGGCRYQADGSRSLGPQASHHGRIDVLHDDGGQLGYHGRNAQLHGQAQLLSQRHRLPLADQREQPVRSINLCSHLFHVSTSLEADLAGFRPFLYFVCKNSAKHRNMQ